jgi:membrane protease YdiL (CAAX protease family)
MNLKNTFKRFILLDVLLLILGVSSLFFENESIISFNENVDPMSEMYGLVVLIYLITYLICLFFLYKFKKVGKQMYLFLFILGVLLSILMGYTAQSSLAYVLDGLGWANTGAILTLLYFSPIKKEF